MVIRRIRQHVAAHNWLAVGIDLLIVVLGVFLGIQASNWNEARLEAVQGASYRQRLIDELDFNIRQHRQQLAYYQQALGHGQTALATLEKGATNDPTGFLIDALQLTQVDTSPAKSYIYQEMVSSGLVDSIGPEPVQQAASDYYVQVAATDRELLEEHAYRNIVRGLVPYAVQAELQEKCGDRHVFHNARIIGVRLVETCDLRLDKSVAGAAAAALRNEPGIQQELVRYLGSIHERLQALQDSLLLADRLKKSLREPAAA